MSAQRVALFGVCVALLRCSSAEDRPPLADVSGEGGASQTRAGSATIADSGSSDSETNEEADGGASDSPPEASVCGNGIQEVGEPCDQDDFGELSCRSFGFSAGALRCDDCQVDSSDCAGVEACTDGADNDGDDDIDCADDDCQEACADPCADPWPLADAAPTTGEVFGQGPGDRSSCALEGQEGGQVVYAYTPPLDGVADLQLRGLGSELSLSVRTDCADATSELYCTAGGGIQSALVLEVTEGETLYLVVETPARDRVTDFELRAFSHPIVCGDGYVDADEACDDGNVDDSDGCSNQCLFQPDEVEPNDTVEEANASEAFPFFGAIATSDDVDVVTVQVDGSQTLIAQTFDLGDGACAQNRLDSVLTILDETGDVVAEDDDTGTGFCSAVVAEALAEGSYYVSVSAGSAAESFLYRLDVTLLER